MGKRGPAQRPSSLKLLHGERASRINPDEPTPRVAALVAPEQLNPAVQRVWDRTVAELEAMGLAAACDADVLRCFCEAVVVHQRACKILAQSDILLKGTLGAPVRNPAVSLQRDAAHTIRQFAQEFGLSPSARSSITAGSDRGDQDNPFAGTG